MLVNTPLQTCSFVFICFQGTVNSFSRTLCPLCGQRHTVTSAKAHRIVGGGRSQAEGQHAERMWVTKNGI